MVFAFLIAVSSPGVPGDSPGHPKGPRKPAGLRPAAIVRADSSSIVSTFAGNAQHTAIFETSAQDLNGIHWTASIDFDNSGTQTHYGAPLVTPSNTVLVPVKTSTGGFRVDAFRGADGTAKYSLTSDYVMPIHDWILPYQPVLAPGPSGLRLYYPGVGGAIDYIDDPDSDSPGPPVREYFYGAGLQPGFDSTVFVDTPITADGAGSIFFGFRVQGTAPAPLNTTQSGFARIGPGGAGAYVLAGAAANDAAITLDSHGSAPALSNDQSTLYVPVKSSQTEFYAYLLGLDAATLATRYRVFLRDPGSGAGAGVLDNGTASPTVGPDGDVYFGAIGNPNNGARGFLLHFSADLATEKPPGAFGWDNTAAIVPAAMAPSYTGTSSYLIFSKYNNYAISGPYGGDGVNKIALLDPNATEVDPRELTQQMLVMREVLTVAGPTPDAENVSTNYPNAVREWCINTAAVNPATNSVFTPSEDGHIYRWDLAADSLSQAVPLTPGVGEPYVPTVIGPDGTVYTLNGGTLFAVGGLTGVGVTVSSSAPDDRSVVAGQPVTFASAVVNTGASGTIPTGTVTFEDTVYFVIGPSDLGSTTTVLATDVPLDGAGHASVTTSLSAASHFITASYSGDANFGPGDATRIEKVHAGASTTSVVSSPNPSNPGQTVTVTAAVAAVPPASGTPTGLVTFAEGGAILAQVPLSGGVASFDTAALTVGSHTITAVYGSDPIFASSGGQVVQVVRGASSFYTVSPCRVADTRGAPGPSGGPALAANTVRTFPVAGVCEIPPSATAVAINLAVFLPDAGGDLRVYAAGQPAPLASSINFRPGIVRASHAIFPLGSGGQIAVQCDMPSGGTDFFFDVYGYFQ